MSNKDNNNKAGLLIGGFIALGAAFEEFVRRYIRKKKQKKRQEKVNLSSNIYSSTIKQDNLWQLSVISPDSIPAPLHQVSLTEEQQESWKPFILDALGRIGMVATAGHTIDGLLVCDVPISELMAVKGEPGKLRGYVVKDGKYSQQGKFEPASIKQAAPMLVMQAMAAATSQYYQQEISERLDNLDQKVAQLSEYLEQEDRAILIDSYQRLLEYSKQSVYIDTDIQTLDLIASRMNIIREKCRGMLSKVHLDVKFANTDFTEAKRKLESLDKTKYFVYLDMAKNAEVLYNISNVILVKAANSLSLDDSILDKYRRRISFSFWSNYESQFQQNRHDVINYISFAAKEAKFNTKKINDLLPIAEAKFNEAEEAFVRAEQSINNPIRLYFALDNENGNIIQYEISKE